MPRASHHRRSMRWYKSDRWQRIRKQQLHEHPYCQCGDCVYVEAEVVDHIRPHMGDSQLFWDTSNLQSLTARCHNSKKQKEEWHQTRKEYLARRREEARAAVGCDADGIPHDPSHHWNQ